MTRSTSKSSNLNAHSDDPQALRVLLFVQLLELGGSERQCVEMAKALSSEGVQVSVGVMRGAGPLRSQLEQAGIPVIDFPVGSLLRPRAVFQGLRLAAFIGRNRFDVVHACDLYANLFAIPAARLAGVPVTVSSQRDLSDSAWYTPTRRKILREIQKLSTWVFVNSNAIRSYLAKDDGIDPARIRVIYNGIDTSRFPNASGERLTFLAPQHRRIAMVANMHVDVKGHAELLEAAQRVCARHPNTRFLLIGDGALREEFKKQAGAMDVEKNIIFLGHRTDVPRLLAGCEMGVLASRAEGLPNAVLEYMAAGLPVIATNVGGIPEIVRHEVTGLLVPPRDSSALAAAILRLLDERQLCERLGQNAKEFVFSNFDSADLGKKLIFLYGETTQAFASLHQHQTAAND